MQDRLALAKTLPVFATIVLTPMVMRLWSRLSPPANLSGFEDFGALRRRNGWINLVFTFAMFCGFALPFFLFGRKLNSVGWPSLGLAFGGAVILPWSWICAATLPLGLSRYHEFWRYYELRYRIGMAGIAAVYLPLAFIGVASVFELFRRDTW